MFHYSKYSIYRKVLFILLVGCLGSIFCTPVVLAQTPGNFPKQTVAVLFLVDESGGMNRECRGVVYTSPNMPQSNATVLDVDSEERKRYQIIRFFMALMGSVYDIENGRPASDRNALPAIEVGIAQFADSYKLVYPFTPAENLFTIPFSIDARDPELDPCYTNYTVALENAAHTLEQTTADHRILILITDGSFRGSEINWSASIEKHTEIRNQVGDVFHTLKQKGIDTSAFVIGSNLCGSENICGLRVNEHDMRRGDLGKWIEWDNDDKTDYLSLLQVDKGDAEIIESVISIPLMPGVSIRDITPSGKIISSESAPITLPSIVQQATVHVISLYPYNNPSFLSLQPPDTINIQHAPPPTQPHPYNRLGDYWWRWCAQFSPITSPYPCKEQTWDIKLAVNTYAYVWYHVMNRTIQGTPFFVLDDIPGPIVRNNQQSLTANAHIDTSTRPDLQNSSCYQVMFRLYANGETPLESPLFGIANPNLSHTFDLSSIPCATHDVRVEAAIRRIDSTADELAISVDTEITFRPEVVVSEVQTWTTSNPQILEGNVTHIITIPIEYAACNPDFTPHFTLVAEGGVRGADGRPDSDDLVPKVAGGSDKYEMTSPIKIGNRLVYVLKLKAWENGKTYCKYGYCTLDIKIEGAEPVRVPFASFMDSITSTPSKEGTDDPDCICGSAPLMLVLLVWFFVIHIRSK